MDPDLPRLLVSDRQDLPVDLVNVLQTARGALVEEDARATELSLSFVGVEEMSALHERYTGEPGPTDVLSFDLDHVDQDGVRILGDVVICPEVAKQQGRNAFPDEIRLLVVHGILHLLGYDHEELEERRVMWDRQEALTGVRIAL